jgi:myo-inositol 2-dehydrogenase/D-chiro-inositol 1-dehydrogenase
MTAEGLCAYRPSLKYFSSHDIGVCRWIVGEDPTEVFAYASAFKKEIKEMDDWDTVLITLKFPSGALGSIDLSRKACYGYGTDILWSK